jgi:hypothetical protein
MAKKGTNQKESFVTTVCGNCVELEAKIDVMQESADEKQEKTEEELDLHRREIAILEKEGKKKDKKISKIERLLEIMRVEQVNQKNELASQKNELASQKNELASQKNEIDYLHEIIENRDSDITVLHKQLEPLRIRQLIGAGRSFFWDNCGHEFECKHPSSVKSISVFCSSSNRNITIKLPERWSNFIYFAKSKYGYATYWDLLKGGANSEFADLSLIVHDDVRFDIAISNTKFQTPPQHYNDLFKKIYNMSMEEAVYKGA